MITKHAYSHRNVHGIPYNVGTEIIIAMIILLLVLTQLKPYSNMIRDHLSLKIVLVMVMITII